VEPTTFFPIATLFAIPTVAYGGWALLTLITGGKIPAGELADWQKTFFRAGHAHAGVLLVLTLVYMLYLPRADFAESTEWVIGIVLFVGVLAQSSGFFLHLALGQPDAPSIGTKVTRAGGLLLGAALIALAVGLIQAA
jgi:hypothetical protein